MKIQATPVFEKIWENDKRIISLVGGTRSSKTYSMIQFSILRLMKQDNKILSICRDTLPSLKSSILRDIIDIMETLGVYSPSNHNKTDGIIKLGTNIIEYFSLDDEMKVRGRKRNYLVVDEVNEVGYDEFLQLLLRTEGDEPGSIILAYNPSQVSGWIYDFEERDDVNVIKSTFKDNPYLSKDVVNEILKLKDTDENLWRIYGLGERGREESLVFPNWETFDDIPEGAKKLGYGCDWGWTDPTSLCEVWRRDNELYLKEIIHTSNITIQEFIYLMDKAGLDKMDTYWADSANPSAIQEVRYAGYNIKPVKKETIMYGVDLMKRFKIFIHSKSKNAIEEFKFYKYKRDKDNKILPMPEDKYNHFIDSARYCITSVIKRERNSKITLI
jgi:phage terminase large subunit